MIKKGTPVKGSKVLMLGITFKENCLPAIALPGHRSLFLVGAKEDPRYT